MQTLSQDSTFIRHQACQKYIKKPSSHTHCMCMNKCFWLTLSLAVSSVAAFSCLFNIFCNCALHFAQWHPLQSLLWVSLGAFTHYGECESHVWVWEVRHLIFACHIITVQAGTRLFTTGQKDSRAIWKCPSLNCKREHNDKTCSTTT